MKQRAKRLAQGALIAAIYALMCYLQNLLIPNSASFAIQLRAAEALCILAYFTPAAIPGLSLGCLIFNLSSAGALPLDFLLGPIATAIATWGMWLTRRFPWPGLLFPAIANGLLIGWELSHYMGGLFWLNAGYVAAGEAIVMLTLGLGLYGTIRARKLHAHLQ